jgi:transcriptional regulator with XRE-family HTH domain
MPPRLRALQEAERRSTRSLREQGAELREARIAAGLTQADVARALGSSASKVGRIERGEDMQVSAVDLARVAAVVGRQLWMRIYPAPGALRDAPQLDVEAKLLEEIKGAAWEVMLEQDVGIVGDLRAFDVELRGVVRIGVEFFTRLRDVQAQIRPVMQKQRDSGVDRLLLVFKDTHANRRAVREAGPALRAAFPMQGRLLIAALREGRDPGANGILFL